MWSKPRATNKSFRRSFRKKLSFRKRRPTYRKKRFTRKPVISRRRILNITSHKKSDTRIPYNVATSVIGPTLVPSAATELWTSQLLNYLPPSEDSETNQDFVRSQNSVFLRGVKLRWNFNMSNATPFEVRIICIWGAASYIDQDTSARFFTTQTDASTGEDYVVSGLLPLAPSLYPFSRSLLFQGNVGIDWIDPMIAPLDRHRNQVVYDKRFLVKSNNNVGSYLRKNIWIPANRTVQYSNDERGSTISGTTGFPLDNVGNNFLYMFTLFSQVGAGDAAAALNVECNTTIYWHEK